MKLVKLHKFTLNANGFEDVQRMRSHGKKIRAKSGGHLYHHIHELDCTLFIMDETPSTVFNGGGECVAEGENLVMKMMLS